MSAPGGKTCSTSTTSCTVAGLTTGTSYTFTVTALNGVGTGPASAASTGVTAITVPGVPTGLGGSGGTVGNPVTITPSWTAPASNGGSGITGYTITLYTGTNCTGTPTTISATTSPTTISSGLTAGRKYYFTVTATNGDGPGSASSCYSTGLTAN